MSAEKTNGEPNSDQARSRNRIGVPLSVDDQQIADLAVELAALKPEQIEAILPLAKWSLDAVTHLTEYEDEKANRIMTAVAFLSAIVSVAFAAIIQRYPLSTVAEIKGFGFHVNSVLLAVLYILFGFYFCLLTIGSAFTLYAVRPQFRIPSAWGRTKTTPGSFLFFNEILNVSGKNWGRSFTQSAAEILTTEYAKNAIFETYLIAQKIPLKLRPLKRGIACFFLSTVILIALLPLCAFTVAYREAPPTNPVPAQTGPAQSKSETEVTRTSVTDGVSSAGPATPKSTDQKRRQPTKKDSSPNPNKPE